jgi:circadian clock protein KaiC
LTLHSNSLYLLEKTFAVISTKESQVGGRKMRKEVAKRRQSKSASKGGLEKVPTGIRGFDEITGGGLPKGRPTLIAGGAGSGKTLFGMEFLVRGILHYDEPGVFVSFEERIPDLEKNFSNLGFDLAKLESQKKLALDHVRIERSEIEETGEYDLEGLFVRLEYAVESVKAKRLVIDTIEALFSGLLNANILRAELRRLFSWIKTKGLTAIVTGEQGQGTLTRFGLEEYVADCVIFLDHRVINQISTRRLRVLKYRGSAHGTNEYPFLLTENGISVFPITSIGLDYKVSSERISSGIKRLDSMLGGGFYRGSSILVSGTAGTGKTSIASTFCDAACRRGEKCLYFSLEESEDQIVRNMKSIGLDLRKSIQKKLLTFHNIRPTLHGLETHLVMFINVIDDIKPTVVVIDPITALPSIGSVLEVKLMLARLIDFLKSKGVTGIIVDLTHAETGLETSTTAISSLIDTWIILRDIESGGERTRGMYIVKSRGTQHSNQIREFLITSKGLDLLDVQQRPRGTARMAMDAEERAAEKSRRQEIERQKRELQQKKKQMEIEIEEEEQE